MQIRSHRLSDVVSWVCVPVTLLLYLHVHLDTTTTTTTGITTSLTSLRVIPPPLNLTSLSRPDLLLVTPILRCGSTTLLHLLRLLAPRNGFRFTPRPPRRSEYVHIPNAKIQEEIAKNLSSVQTPAALMEPFAYINFTSYGFASPIHVAVIRDPVERAVSRYYQARAPFALVERQQLFPGTKLPSRSFLKKDLETCLRSPRDPECKYQGGKQTLGHTVEFFCGHHDYCPIFGDRAGLVEAMRVVEEGWVVVGVLEEWNKTLAVMETLVPRFFSGATQLYYEHIHASKTMRNENFYRPSVELEAVWFMKQVFELEYEFYEFVKQRLDRQYRAVVGR